MHGDAELSAAIHTRGAATQLCRASGQSCRQAPLAGRLHLAPLSVSCRANPLIRQPVLAVTSQLGPLL